MGLGVALKFTSQEIRDSYYIMRAMHDGACPNCGQTDSPEAFEEGGTLTCYECWFYISEDELIGIKKVTAATMVRRIDSFSDARARLAELGQSYDNVFEVDAS